MNAVRYLWLVPAIVTMGASIFCWLSATQLRGRYLALALVVAMSLQAAAIATASMADAT